MPMSDSSSAEFKQTATDKLPTADDYRTIGINVVNRGLDDASTLRLFNDWVDHQVASNLAGPVAHFPNLDQAATISKKITALANQKAGDTIAAANAIGKAEWDQFVGASTLDNSQPEKLAVIHFALQSKEAKDYVSRESLVTLMTAAVDAFDKLLNMDSQSSTSLTLQQYQAMGFTGIRDTGDNANLEAINSVVRSAAISIKRIGNTGSSTDLSAMTELQGRVNSYNKLFAQANGTADDTPVADYALLTDYENIGITTTGLTALAENARGNALKLLNSLLDRLRPGFELTLTDVTGYSTRTQVQSTLRIDTRTAPTLSASKVETGNQISFGMLTLNDNLGDTSDRFKHNLAPGESVTLPLPPGFTRETFLTALKAISSDWGGPGISGSADSILSRYRSYTTFGATPVIDSPIAVPHQSHTNVKGVKVKFTTVNGDLKLKSDTSFYSLTETDMYRFDGTNTKNEGAYDMGNIRLLYQTTTTSANSTPTIAVTYDRANARIGDVIALYEGNKLLASKTLDSTDVGSGMTTLNLKVNTSLSQGDHHIVSKYTSTSGATSQAAAVTVNVGAEMKVPVLTDLKVKASYDADTNAKPVLLDGKSYTSVTDPGNNGVYDKGLIFTGRINTPELAGKQKYLVSISLGGKTLGFDIFELETTDNASTSSFTLQAGSNLLAPGLYRDLTVAVTNVTEGSAYSGQTSVIKDAALGWYWAAQSMGNIRGGNGNDGMILSAPASASSTVTTGGGADTLTLGAFGKPGNFSATVTDFQLGLDKVLVAGQTITAANFNSFVQSVAAGPNNSTTLTVDLDGAGSGTQTYTLTLQNLLYNPANTQTIFGF